MRRSPPCRSLLLLTLLALSTRGGLACKRAPKDKHRPVPPLAPLSPAKPLLFEADFEQASDIGDFDLSWLHNRWAAKVVQRVARHGKGALEVSLRRKDEMASKGKRAELAVPFSYRRGESYWYGFSVYLPKSWKRDFQGDVVAQWFAHEDRHLGERGRSPALALRLREAFWYVTYRWDDRAVTPDNSGHKGKIYKARYQTGRWTDWVFHVRWSYDPKATGAAEGLVEVYKNGKKVAERRGPNTYNDKAGPTLKLGIYKAPWNKPETPSAVDMRLLYLDEVRIGSEQAGYRGVAPRAGP